MSSLPADDAERVGRDPGGSRVLEALVAGAASAKQKARLLRALHGRWAGLAGEFGGSHLVEKCFAAAVCLLHVCPALTPVLLGCRHGSVIMQHRSTSAVPPTQSSAHLQSCYSTEKTGEQHTACG